MNSQNCVCSSRENDRLTMPHTKGSAHSVTLGLSSSMNVCNDVNKQRNDTAMTVAR